MPPSTITPKKLPCSLHVPCCFATKTLPLLLLHEPVHRIATYLPTCSTNAPTLQLHPPHFAILNISTTRYSYNSLVLVKIKTHPRVTSPLLTIPIVQVITSLFMHIKGFVIRKVCEILSFTYPTAKHGCCCLHLLLGRHHQRTTNSPRAATAAGKRAHQKHPKPWTCSTEVMECLCQRRLQETRRQQLLSQFFLRQFANVTRQQHLSAAYLRSFI